MNPFEQYGQVHGYKHPKRPWWRVISPKCTNSGAGRYSMPANTHIWARRDGLKFAREDNSGREDSVWLSWVQERDLPDLNEADLDNPLPVPKPCAGQVWRSVTDSACRDWIITAVRHTSDGKFKYVVDHNPYPVSDPQWLTHWPPGPLLLDGPGAPWMKPGFKLSDYSGWGSEDWGLE